MVCGFPQAKLPAAHCATCVLWLLQFSACFMKGKLYLNGSDYLMQGFDHELRRHGFAGNSCQIILELGGTISPELLEQRLGTFLDRYPILSARPGGFFLPRWKLPRKRGRTAKIRVHRADPILSERTFNEPLDTRRGEL